MGSKGKLQLTLTLTFDQFLDFALGGASRDSGGALGFGSGLPTRYALQLLAFFSVFYVLCIHSSTLIPANFSTIFFNP